MTGKEIISTINVDYPEDFRFIVSMLDIEHIEDTAEKYAAAYPKRVDLYNQLGLEYDGDPVKGCYHKLSLEASKKMWQQISKNEVNALLEGMYAAKAVSVKMPDGGDYTPPRIIETWKEINGEEE